MGYFSRFCSFLQVFDVGFWEEYLNYFPVLFVWFISSSFFETTLK
ncbi:hypothetical protein E1A91_D09G246800v1 [Gossypium mustelinum]|uniref:Uncharacterized protein n=1 Tax=Gossypium mustelinum TaxID=34275 RepID=A0A5D2TPY9_GOSMU|nr:hypothetical protein E1A91_D09G246800v1 [Gossypium mustelinum]